MPSPPFKRLNHLDDFRRKASTIPADSRHTESNQAGKNERERRRKARQQLRLKPGDVFDPARLFSEKKLTGGLIPSEIRECRELSMGAKVLYSALMEWKATQVQVFPSMERLGLDIGVSDKQARRYVIELEKLKLIQVIRRKDENRPGKNHRNEYQFLYHEWFDRLPTQETVLEEHAADTPQSDPTRLTILPDSSLPYSQECPSGTPHSGRQVTSLSNTRERHQEAETEKGNLRQTEIVKAGQNNDTRQSQPVIPVLPITQELQNTAASQTENAADQFTASDAGPGTTAITDLEELTEEEQAMVDSWSSHLSTAPTLLDRTNVQWRKDLKKVLQQQGSTLAHLDYVIKRTNSVIFLTSNLASVERIIQKRFQSISFPACFVCFDSLQLPDRKICLACDAGRKRNDSLEWLRAHQETKRKAFLARLEAQEQRNQNRSKLSQALHGTNG